MRWLQSKTVSIRLGGLRALALIAAAALSITALECVHDVKAGIVVEGDGEGYGWVNEDPLHSHGAMIPHVRDCRIEAGVATPRTTVPEVSACHAHGTFELHELPLTFSLKATPDEGSAFGGWVNCRPNANDPLRCEVLVDVEEIVTVTAKFHLASAPMANAGSDQSVDVGATLTLDGTNSSDPDGDDLTYSWALVDNSGPTQSSIVPTATPGVVTFFMDEPNQLVFELTVTDPSGLDDTDQVTAVTNAPTISGIDPPEGPVGIQVNITGTNFSPTASRNTVTFNGESATVTFAASSYDELRAEVPATTPIGPGPVKVAVVTGDEAEWQSFTVIEVDPWTRWSSGAVDRDLHAVSFVDATHGWAVGSQGTILTTDGTTWSAQTSGTMEQLRAVSFTDVNTGTAVGLNGTILHTTSGGDTWNAATIPGHANVFYWSVSVVGQNAWAAGWVSVFGGQGIIVSTDDGWSNWSVDTIPGFSPSDVVFLDVNTGWLVGNDATSSVIYWTTAGAGNWTPAQTIPDCFPSAVTFVDASNGWAVGTKSGGETCVISSTDGGQNWTDQSSGLPGAPLLGQANDVSFASALVGTIVGATIYRTENGGVVWVEETYPTGSLLNGVEMLSTTEAVAVGGHLAGDEALIIRRQ